MSSALPTEIRVEQSRHGTSYLLPPRETGPLKLVAVFFIGFGCLFGGFALFWILGVLSGSFKGPAGAFNVVFALFGLPFLAAGLGIIGLGVFAWRGRCELEVRPGELITRERGGPFWWTRRISTKDIQHFKLWTQGPLYNNHPIISGPMSNVATLCAVVGAGKPRFILLGYPRAWVEALAARLAADIALQTGAAPLAVSTLGQERAYYRHEDQPLPGEVSGPPRRIIVHGDRVDRPTGTNIQVTEQAGGLVVLIPPQGFRTARGLLSFAVIWLTLVGIFVAFMGFVSRGKSSGQGDGQIIAVVVGSHLAICVALLTIAVNQMRRRASIRATREELIIVQRSLFRTTTFKRSVCELDTIAMDDSGIVANNVSVQELRIYDKEGSKQGFFVQLSNDELLWLATHLRRATGVGEVPSASGEPPKLAI